MASPAPSGRTSSAALIAVILAAVIAVGAIGYKLVSGGSDEGAATTNAAAATTNMAEGGDVDQMIGALHEALRREPDNHEGWFRLGLALRETHRFAEAAQAFRRAAELAPRNADYQAYLGETVLLMGGGDTPPPEAERLFRRALELEPGNPQARYYLATLKDHGGNHRGALDDLLALLHDAPADAPWVGQVRDAATAIAGRNHIDITGRLPAAPPSSAAASATAAIPGPTPEQMRSASAIPPGQQDEMVRNMVGGLAARLRRNPHDANGWVQLMRSRMVLNDAPAAHAALASALAAFQDDAATQAQLRSAAAALGVQ
jgi:cytochrome c-type biogenesis protein CcmH